ELEARIALAARDWRDDLQLALEEVLGEEVATELVPRYRNAFSPAYRSDFVPRIAAADVVRMEALGSREDLGVAVYRRPEDEASDLRVKLYRRDEPLLLCDLLPILENLGLQVLGERPYEIERSGAGRVFVHDFYTRHLGPADLELGELERRLDEALQAVWAGRVEDDGFHRLIVRSRLRSRQIALLRTICRYLQQVRVPWSQAYMERAVTGNEAIAELLVELFETRFDPALSDDRDTRLGACRAGIEAALEEVPSLDEDRILRAFLAVVEATDRVNVFQSPARPYVALKLAPQRLDYLPRPRPLHEIYVYAPRFEGVHLRSGGVARGGLRWSDRLEDYRTEVLGLMKAQVVKNAVIVPVGAKGGFVVRPDSAGGAPSRDEVVACYQDFIRGLLDLTDNLVEGKVEPPPDVVRYDGDDPYLVVAADKGTATFSDIANGVAIEHGFWLGDAFASGGSIGYDHKGMGITARGAWESVKRHFRELGHDTQTQDFTVVGIGDMAGDVF
ncbi:MAG: NAD-glutamate dehydrogenase, partial [Thermoanaerobaculia bacterium]|nr:NAD-glutamate dehydrogenase [Thermoanaerobaculia bacterium]